MMKFRINFSKAKNKFTENEKLILKGMAAQVAGLYGAVKTMASMMNKGAPVSNADNEDIAARTQAWFDDVFAGQGLVVEWDKPSTGN